MAWRMALCMEGSPPLRGIGPRVWLSCETKGPAIVMANLGLPGEERSCLRHAVGTPSHERCREAADTSLQQRCSQQLQTG